MRRASVLAVLIALAIPGAAIAARDVTDTPVVQRDLVIAVAYWHRMLPGVTNGPVTVVVARMQPAEGPNGVMYAPEDIEAETVAGASVITLAPRTWANMTKRKHETVNGRTLREVSVRVVIHEYGHVLGLDDVPEGNGTDAEEVSWAWAGR
jgi:hypothetical protein